MFEHDDINEFDLQMRSILDGGQEEVPAGLWEGVSAGLDKVARKRKVVLWLRNSGIAVAAAAAVAVGVVFNHGSESDIVPAAGSEELIAVVKDTDSKEDVVNTVESIGKAHSQSSMIAMADITDNKDISGEASEAVVVESVVEAAAEMKQEGEIQATDNAPVTEKKAAPQPTIVDVLTDQTDWKDEDEPVRKTLNTSLVISGIAGTNSPQNKGGLKPLRAPGIMKVPTKTTIEHIGDETTYGIPVSVGLGVKINFTRRWALGVGVNYTLLTSNFNGKYTKVENGVPSLPISERVKNTQHYVGIPVNAYYNIVNRDFINFYAYAGGTVEKCVGNIYQIQTTPVINHSEAVKGVQLSANAGIGVEFLLGKYVGIYLDPSLRYYFKGNQPKSIRTAQPLMLGFEAGVRFNL